MTRQDLEKLSNFLRHMAEKTARFGSESSLAFSAAANKCEEYFDKYFRIEPTKVEIEAAIAYFKSNP